MTNNRLDEVVTAISAAVRDAVRDENVTFEEYRAAIGYLMKVAESGELPLFIDVFMNATIVSIINKNADPAASPSDMEGPYFLDGAPEVTDGKIKTMEAYADDEPLVVRGTVKDVDGTPLSNVLVDIWSSTPDGKYSGIHDNIPVDYYRGKVRTDVEGKWEVETTMPVPYQIPNKGPTGALLEMMGRHSWRPAHVHLKVRHPGYRELITQLYFEEDEWVHSDCCEGIVPEEFIYPRVVEGGKRVLDANLVIEPQVNAKAA
jgi:chlorocatechol 1,2-dioxygenase